MAADFHPSSREKKCTYAAGTDMSGCPHLRREWKNERKIAENVLELIGNTPLVKLNKIPLSLGMKCDVLAKCEYLNPAGSVKDRVAYNTVLQAEKDELLKPGSTIVCPSNGTFGVGIALVAAIKGYDCIIVTNEELCKEKRLIMEALGATVEQTPLATKMFEAAGVFGVAYKRAAEIQHSWIADQYVLPANPMVHYDTTAEEILDQCEGKIDMFVSATETGGTLSGVAQRIKEACPDCKFVGADIIGSRMANPDSMNETLVKGYEAEGVGCPFQPVILNQTFITDWQKVGDMECHLMGRRLIKEEGLLCGPSSGVAMCAAMRAAKNLQAGAKCVVILADTARNYFTKFVDDKWMEMKKFQIPSNVKNEKWREAKVFCLKLKPPVMVTPDQTIHRVFHTMKKEEVDIVAVVEKCSGNIIGVVEQDSMIRQLVKGDITSEDRVDKATNSQYIKATCDSNLGLLSRILEESPYAIIVEEKCSVTRPIGIMRPIDILQHTTKGGGGAGGCC